ncbi:hypothetical protein ACFQY4_14930 [Catellatospora bangladeshensis]|uniref:hypothetical protein n=1 Tax=Catellatospora bangladeshensis TaxID=310355 RepID=UPI003612F6A5
MVNANDLVEGPSRINVRVPLQLLRAGVRLASLVRRRRCTRSTRSCTARACPST